MKNKFLKISSLILSFGMIVSNFPSVLAGGGLSKPKMSAQEQRAQEISCNQIKYTPIYAEDGGLAYFWSWNGFRWKEDFATVVAKYRSKANNITSARTLSDSTHNSNWVTSAQFGNAYTLESFEEIQDPDPTKYLLRIDTEKNLIYTVRKAGDLYLFTFYLAACTDYTNPKVCLSCFAVSSDIRNIKNILLPIDQALFD